MKKLFLAVVFVLSLSVCNGFDASKQIEYANEIVGYQMFHTHLEMDWILTAQMSEIIGKEIYRLCTMMNTPARRICKIAVRNWTTIY